MAFNSNHFYTSDHYVINKPEWDDQDTGWKAKRIDQMLRKNKLEPNKVVEIGCGGGGILEKLCELNPSIVELFGYDISPQAIELANKKVIRKAHFAQLDFVNSAETGGDVVLVIDVLEHVDDFYGFLNKIREKSKYCVFHIPLDLSCRQILKPHILLQQRESVGHIHYFTREIVEWALHDTGFKIVDWHYTKPDIDVHPPKNLFVAFKKLLRKISFAISEEWSVKLWGGYSILILTK